MGGIQPRTSSVHSHGFEMQWLGGPEAVNWGTQMACPVIYLAVVFQRQGLVRTLMQKFGVASGVVAKTLSHILSLSAHSLS